MMLWPQACPSSGQRVVFGADTDHQRAAAELGAERGVQPGGGSGDLEAVLGDQRLRLGAALVLGEGKLRLGVNGVGQLDKSLRRRLTASSTLTAAVAVGILAVSH